MNGAEGFDDSGKHGLKFRKFFQRASFFIAYIVMMTRPQYFPILDALRFLASLSVFLAHSIVFFRLPVGVKGVADAGYFGVIFFYTLSGFLITYLLLKEKENTGGIAIKAFYVRRILRIWPLYYGIVLLSFFVFPYLLPGHGLHSMGEWKRPFLLYLLFLPNVAVLGGFYLATCFHTYTIGYEEQFYLFWPLLLRKAGGGLGYLLAGLFVLPWGLDLLRVRIGAHDAPFSMSGVELARGVLTFVSLSNLPAFVAGGAAAVVYLRGGIKLRAVAGSKVWRWVLTAAILALMCFTVPGGPGYVNGVSVLFAMLIVHLVLSGAQGGKAGALLARGGKISYGIYIFHAAVLIFVSHCLTWAHIGSRDEPWGAYILYLAVAFVLLLLVAAVSYRYFEGYFLRKKWRWEPWAALRGGGGQTEGG